MPSEEASSRADEHGSTTTEENIPPDVPPDVEDIFMRAVDLAPTIRGASMMKYEACKKIKNGTELAQVSTIESRKFRELVDLLYDTATALNVKSTARDVAGSYTTDLASIVQQMVEHGASAGLWTNSTTP